MSVKALAVPMIEEGQAGQLRTLATASTRSRRATVSWSLRTFLPRSGALVTFASRQADGNHLHLGRETLIVTIPARGPSRRRSSGGLGWAEAAVRGDGADAQSATAFFNLPPNRVVEMGAQIQF